MAQNQRPSGPRPQSSSSMPGLQDSAPRSTATFEYDVPSEDGLLQEVTKDFGVICAIGLRLLTPLEEKDAAAACKGDVIQLAYELTRRSIVEVTNDQGQVIQVRDHDGTSHALWMQMHPKIRSMATVAYSTEAAPSEKAAALFQRSRRVKA